MTSEIQTPQKDDKSTRFDPSEGNPFVHDASQVAQDRFINPVQPPTEPVSLESAGLDAQALSDAGAWARAAHNVDQQSAVFEELHDGSKLAKKTARDLAVGSVVTAAGLAVAGHVVGVGIDGFLDGQDQKNEQYQQQQQQWDEQQKQQQFDQGLDAGKVTIDVSAAEQQTPHAPDSQTS